MAKGHVTNVQSTRIDGNFGHGFVLFDRKGLPCATFIFEGEQMAKVAHELMIAVLNDVVAVVGAVRA